jgi:hypothetical protein
LLLLTGKKNYLAPHHPIFTALLLKDIGKRFYERRQVILDGIRA